MMSSGRKIIDFAQKKGARREQLKRLFEEHRPALQSFLLGRLGNLSDVEDVIQDIFVRLMKARDLESRLAGKSGSNRAYLLTIANSMVVDLARRTKVRNSYLESEKHQPETAGREANPSHISQNHQQLDMIRRAIAKLKPMEQQAFVLSRFKSMTYKEISEYLGVSPRPVEDYMGSALTKIRKYAVRFEEYGK